MTLDAFFGPPLSDLSIDELKAGASDEEDGRWRKAAISDPRAWWKRANTITRRLANAIAMDTGIPLDSPGGRNQHALAASLLSAFQGNIDLLLEALDECRRKGMEPGVNLYYLRKMVENKASYMRARNAQRKRMETEADAPIDEEDTEICCRCGKLVINFDEHEDGFVCVDCQMRESKSG